MTFKNAYPNFNLVFCIAGSTSWDRYAGHWSIYIYQAFLLDHTSLGVY
jgi:hypothetical protein